jgi:hypothetical protein
VYHKINRCVVPTSQYDDLQRNGFRSKNKAWADITADGSSSTVATLNAIDDFIKNWDRSKPEMWVDNLNRSNGSAPDSNFSLFGLEYFLKSAPSLLSWIYGVGKSIYDYFHILVFAWC